MANQKRLSREQAAQMYDELRKTMESRYGRKGLEQLMDKERALKDAEKIGGSPTKNMSARIRNIERGGMKAAFALVLAVATAKVGLSAIEASGVVSVESAQASIAGSQAPVFSGVRYSTEEVRLLKSLDARRVELEERDSRLDQKEQDLRAKDREFAAKLTELRELTQKLKGEREQGERKGQAQLEQLANVYVSMNPQEAAQLIEQLDITIALDLLQRMPEKRIGQILALMTPERALTFTRMLSGK